MLKRLSISNYALIDHLEIDFEQGLTIITGETGAGKSIIMGALALILGERADSSSIRDKARKTVVEATFETHGSALKQFFEENDLEYFDDELIARREINPNGRSRAFVNDGVVALSTMRELMTRMVDIHSQHSNMLLSTTAFQLQVLDNMGGNNALLDEYRKTYTLYKKTGKELELLRENMNRSRGEEDYLRFQLNQLQELALKPGEDEELEQTQRRLANASSLKEELWRVSNILDGDDNSLIRQLREVELALANAEKNLNEVEGMAGRVNSALIDIKDIAQSVAAIEEDLNDDPATLQQVEERLAAIYSLQRKHGVQDANALLTLQEQLTARLDNIDHSEEKIAQVEARLSEIRDEATTLAQSISRNRREAAQHFINAVKPAAVNLGMKNIMFEICFTPTELSPTGTDNVDFLFAFNKNQQLMPVKDTASGGEISRLMLCIKSVIAQTMNLPTIIFDEVDTGVSGEIANKIGDMMGDIARRIQVIAITHLPQVASHGTAHLRVFKTDNDTQTTTGITPLDYEQHVREVARMLSGNEINQAALDNARSLIETNTAH